jgi:nucleoside triphosphate pyrophosphatase
MKYRLSYSREFGAELINVIGKTKIVLASNSPRRAEILKKLGLKFDKFDPDIDENIDNYGSPVNFAVRLAQIKANSVSYYDPGVIVAADTIVVLNDRIMGKPEDHEEAYDMLTELSNQTHSVITGMSLTDCDPCTSICGYCMSWVTFKELKPEIIQDYIDSGEPFGKAGAYAIQGKGGILVESYDGDLDNIIGFPAGLFMELFRKLKSEV